MVEGGGSRVEGTFLRAWEPGVGYLLFGVPAWFAAPRSARRTVVRASPQRNERTILVRRVRRLGSQRNMCARDGDYDCDCSPHSVESSHRPTLEDLDPGASALNPKSLEP